MTAADGQYRFEMRFADETDESGRLWQPITESYVRRRLAAETPDPDLLDDIIAEMKRSPEAQADDGLYAFRAVRAGSPEGWRIGWTTAPVDYFGWGTMVLDSEAGTNDRGQVIRKIVVDPKHWDWHVQRCASGLHVLLTEDELPRFHGFWTINTKE